MAEHQHQRFEKSGMRIAFRQQPQMGGDRLKPVDSDGAIEEPRRVQLQRFDGKSAEMFVETRAPGDFHLISGLKHRLQLAGSATTDETEMTAVRPGHHLGNGGGFAMPPDAKNYSLVTPFHA